MTQIFVPFSSWTSFLVLWKATPFITNMTLCIFEDLLISQISSILRSMRNLKLKTHYCCCTFLIQSLLFATFKFFCFYVISLCVLLNIFIWRAVQKLDLLSLRISESDQWCVAGVPNRSNKQIMVQVALRIMKQSCIACVPNMAVPRQLLICRSCSKYCCSKICLVFYIQNINCYGY